MFVSRVLGPLCCPFCWSLGGSGCGSGEGCWAFWTSGLLLSSSGVTVCGGDLEAFFHSVLSLDLLPNGLEADRSTCGTNYSR